MASYDSLIFLGGTFSEFQYPLGYGFFAAVDKNSGQLSAWRPNVGGDVNEMRVHESKLFMGGNMYYNSDESVLRRKFLVFSLIAGPQMSSIQDIVSCDFDTIGPIPFYITDSVDVNTLIFNISSSDTSIISNSNVLLSGVGSNRFITLIPSPGVSGNVTIYVKATNQSGGSSYSSFNVNINPASVSIAGTPFFCSGDSTHLDVGPGYSSYQWNTGAVNSSIIVSQSGNYIITVMNSSGCVAMDSVNVIENLLPQINIISGSSTDICQGDSVLLIADAGFLSYEWLINNNQIIGANSTSFYANISGKYSCLVNDSIGCQNQSNNIKVNVVCFPWGPNNEKQNIDEVSEEWVILVSPNPSTEYFILESDCFNDSETQVKIFDARLSEIYSEKIKPGFTRFVIKRMSPGIYFLKVQCGVRKSKWIKLIQAG